MVRLTSLAGNEGIIKLMSGDQTEGTRTVSYPKLQRLGRYMEHLVGLNLYTLLDLSDYGNPQFVHSGGIGLDINSFSFSSRWHCTARKGLYTLGPVSHQSDENNHGFLFRYNRWSRQTFSPRII